MSQDVGVEQGRSPGGTSGAGRRTGSIGWRWLQVAAAIGTLASLVVPMVAQLSFESFLLAMAAPFLIGLLVLIRWPRVGAAWLGVASLAILLFSAPFIVDALAHPEATEDFVPLLVLTLSTIVGTAAAVPSFRQGPGPSVPSRRARMIAVGAGAVIVVGAIVSVVASAGVQSAPARTGDVRLVAEGIEFNRADIDAESGAISVHVTNKDDTRHTFTVDEVGVDLNLPPNSSQRVTFTADPGTYRFYCRPHTPGMEGVLIVR